MLRYMAWLCLKDDTLKGWEMCIVTGPRIDMAVWLIARLKSLFANNVQPLATAGSTITLDTKENIIVLNGVYIEAYPSHHLDAMRGIPNVSFILLDEADFVPPGQQQYARDVSEIRRKIQSMGSDGVNTKCFWWSVWKNRKRTRKYLLGQAVIPRLYIQSR